MAKPTRPQRRTPKEDQEPWVAELLRTDHGFELLALARTLAGIPPGLAPEDRQALSGVALLLLLAAQEGHTRLPLHAPETQDRLALFLGEGATLPGLLARPGLAQAFGRPGEPLLRPLVAGDGWIASARLQAAESRLAGALGQILKAGPRGRFDRELPLPDCREVLDSAIGLSPAGEPTHFSEEQKQAVLRAVAGPLTLLTGGPGTGKTSIVAAILRVALRAGLDLGDIALAAPTGKAAQRMGESIRGALGKIAHPDGLDLKLLEATPEPQTLHRLLAFLPARQAFRHHRNNPLPFRLVVVDESSMVGLELMDGLVEALGPGARLVLLGDAEQLPSVEAGAVFRDLVQALPAAKVQLTHSYRMDAGDPGGRSVLLAAQALRAGDGDALQEPGVLTTRAAWTELKGVGAEHAHPDRTALRAFLASYQKQEVVARAGFKEAAERVYRHDGQAWAAGDEAALESLFLAHEHARILCPLREGGNLGSVTGLNLALHRLAGPSKPLDRDLEVYAGEPVMVNRNDYGRDLFNGDQGVVVKAFLDGGVHQAAVFRSGKGFRLLPYRSIQAQLELAWALTVHKAQGSEFDRVVVVLPPEDSPLLTQEILYTALTRARTGATLLGSPEALGKGMRSATLRSTGLAEFLAPSRPTPSP